MPIPSADRTTRTIHAVEFCPEEGELGPASGHEWSIYRMRVLAFLSESIQSLPAGTTVSYDWYRFEVPVSEPEDALSDLVEESIFSGAVEPRFRVTAEADSEILQVEAEEEELRTFEDFILLIANTTGRELKVVKRSFVSE